MKCLLAGVVEAGKEKQAFIEPLRVTPSNWVIIKELAQLVQKIMKMTPCIDTLLHKRNKG